MKYVLLKGLKGFGDRLQCLLQAIRYAKATQRCLVVDWRDKDWCHDENYAFDAYFSLKGLSSMSYPHFIDTVSKLHSLEWFPAAWVSKLKARDFDLYINHAAFKLPENGKCIERISAGLRKDFTEDVVVYPGVGERVFHYADISHVTIDHHVEAYILQFADQLGLFSKSYDVVHLRGGTKHWAGGSIEYESPVKHLHTQWDTHERYLEEIYHKHLSGTSSKERLPLYILSDMPNMAELWFDAFGRCQLISNSAHGQMVGSGIHLLDMEALMAGCNATKHQLNLECIRDFVIMLNARSLVGDGVSLFSLMAQKFRYNNLTLLPFARRGLEEGNINEQQLTKFSF